MTAKKNDIIQIALKLDFFKEMLKPFSLDQMQDMATFLNKEIHQRIEESRTEEDQFHYKKTIIRRRYDGSVGRRFGRRRGRRNERKRIY